MNNGVSDERQSSSHKIKNALVSIIKVASSNMITVLAGVFVGFIIPKILSVTDYGYYKQFSLYCTYIGLFSIGIADGIVLKFGNYNIDMLDKKYFRSIFRWFLFLQGAVGLIMVLIAISIHNNEIRFLVITLGLNIVAMNVVGFFRQISQITQRFNEYAFRNVINSILSILSALIMLAIYVKSNTANYHTYVCLLLITNYILAIWYTFTYRELVFGSGYSGKAGLGETKKLVIMGFPLMCANLCSTLILTIDRQFVSLLFTTSEYAVYAFAYNLLSLVTVATSACAVVIYPILKRSDEKSLQQNYQDLIFVILGFCFFMIGCYYPLCVFIKWYLPDYVGALEILRVIFPGLSITSAITIVVHNYYKTLQLSTLFFKKSVVIIILSAIANVIAFCIYRKPIAISVASIIVMIFWYEYTNVKLTKKFNIQSKKNTIYLLLLMISFYIVSEISNMIIGLLVYEMIFIIVSIIFGGKKIINKFYHLN